MSQITNKDENSGGTGDVIGPASATDNALARFDGTTGKLIKNSGVLVDNSNNMSGVAILAAARLGLGNNSSPTAIAQLPAGTAVAGTAPLKLTSGVNLTAPEPGAIEYNGTNLFYTDGTSTRRTLNISSADVVGPAGATANAFPRFNSTTGKIIKDSGVICDDSNNVSGVAILAAAKIGLGNNSAPTALLQIPAGTATAGTAPLKLTSGVNLTAPEPGAIEYNGTNLFYTDGTSARRTLNISSADVVGPAGATANAFSRFNSTTGKLIKDSGVICDDSNNVSGVNSLTFAAGTALSLYQQGTFTPGVAFGGGTTGITYGAQVGQYTRIGNVVYFSFLVQMTSKGSSTGSVTFTGFPVAAGGQQCVMTAIKITNFTINAGYTSLALQTQNATSFELFAHDPTLGDAAVTNTQFANNTDIRFEGFYFSS